MKRHGGRRSRLVRVGRCAALASMAALAVLAALHPRPLGAAQGAEQRGGRSEPIVVASKPFGESYVLAEVFAQLLEARGLEVDRRPGLGATEIAFQALRTGAIDLYPEYTGTGLLAILQETPPASAGAVFRRVSEVFRSRWDVHWLPPLGFENTYAIAVRRVTADSLGLRTLSDLALHAGDLVAGFSPDFIGRADGLPGLTATYGVTLAEVRPLLQAVKYRALAEIEVDVIDGYSTDGAIARYDLVVLRDDLGFFPPYEAAPLASGDLVRRHPEAVAALAEIAGRLDESRMRRANERLEVEGIPPARVARALLLELGVVEVGAADTDTGAQSGVTETDRSGDDLRPRPDGLVSFLWSRRQETWALGLQHLWMVLVSLGAAVIVAVPLGLLLERLRRGAEGVIRGVGLLQTIPGIALLAFMIPVLGIGWLPAVVALFLYSLFPIVRNTYTGVREADPAAVRTAVALGMTPRQVLMQVRLPLAAPILLAGIRTAAVINVGTATLAAFIGAGGLGDPIVAGLALSDTRLILSGALPAALLALIVDLGLQEVERRSTPPGLRE
ncbi:MAG: ABC transporter permease subunit [Gemmatimonadetes bacterium]|nr:ABC transporter permease subunit [Gemmatimonadota bacterium]